MLNEIEKITRILRNLINECLASDFNEHWDSYKQALATLNLSESFNPDDYHGCKTGDCYHETQAECDTSLKLVSRSLENQLQYYKELSDKRLIENSELCHLLIKYHNAKDFKDLQKITIECEEYFKLKDIRNV